MLKVFTSVAMGVLLLIYSIVVIIASAIVNAFVLSMVWGWYVSPYFSIRPLDMVHAFGIMVIANLFRTPVLPGSKTEQDMITGVENPWLSFFFMTFVNPMGALFIAWIGTGWL
jgi:hypothetical protein